MKSNATDDPGDHALELHAATPVFLGYCSSGMHFLPDGRIDCSAFFEDDPRAQGSFPRLRRGGVDIVMVSMGLHDRGLYPGRAAVGRMFQIVSNFRHVAAAHADAIEVAHTGDDIDRIVGEGKAACLLHTVAAEIDGDLSTLAGYKALGVRAMHPPFDTRNPAAGDVECDGGGLSDFGKDVVREMHRLGILVDVSHASDESFWEIRGLVDGPIIASHSNCRALCEASRNITDEQIKAIAESGGVIGVHFGTGFIDLDYATRRRATRYYEKLQAWDADLRTRYPNPDAYYPHRFNMDEWEKTEMYVIEQQARGPGLAKLIDHIDRLVELAGIDHVGIGSDYDLGAIPEEVWYADKLPRLTQALVDRGYSDADIRKIWNGNFRRMFE